MRGLAVGAALVAGCYHPIVASEVPCGPNGECPSGQTCNLNHQPPLCNGPDSADAGVDAAPLLNVCGDTSGLQAGAPWPAVHGCSTNAGRSTMLGPALGKVTQPPFGMNTFKRGAVVGAGNQIVVLEDGAGDILSFDGNTGGAGWTYPDMMGTGVEPVPMIDNQNLLYATTNYGKLYCVDVVTGAGKWNLQFGGAFSAPQMGANGLLYFGSVNPYGFYAIDVIARMQKFHYDVPNSGDAMTAPALGNGLVYFVDTKNSQLFALDAITGDHKFDVPVPGTAVGSPVLGVDIIYVATRTNGIAAFDAISGAVKWQQPVGADVVQPALLATGDVVSSTTDGTAFVLARASGASKYMMSIGGNVNAPPIIDAADTVYFATSAATVAYSATLAFRWEVPLIGKISLGDKQVIVLPPTHTLAIIGE